MSNLERFGNEVWDRLFDLLYQCDESTTDDDVRARLQRAGIDMRPAYRRMHQMIEERTARQQLASAAATREAIIDKLRNIASPIVEDLRSGIKGLIERKFRGSAQLAHYQRLERAATEDDLKTLLEDLTRLAAMRQDQDESKAE